MVAAGGVGRGDAALALLAAGWSIVPLHTPVGSGCSCGRPGCPSPGKHPRVHWERFETRRAGAGLVRSWWSRWPGANLGVVTGELSGVVALDVDPRHGGDRSLEELEDLYGPSRAAVVAVTGGGGRHLYFGHPGRSVVSRPIAPGLDLKGDGGLVVAPPSAHVSGRPYRWIPGCAPGEAHLAPPPSWLLALASQGWPAVGSAGSETCRTDRERAEFAELWAALGVEVRPGDQMYLCPFHEDHHPSLHIDADGCRWLCFGCQRGGGLGRLRRIRNEGGPTGEVAPRVSVTLAGGATVEVAGEAHYQDALLTLTGGRRRYGGVSLDVVAHLLPESGNPADPRAIAVLIGGHKVGYLRREDARRFSRVVEKAIERRGEATCVAAIRGGWERPGSVGMFGVKLWLAAPGTLERGSSRRG